jgi:1-acyl-sn-glycerol-3-phosphate acyltransferase
MRAEKILHQTGESVFLTPEGERVRSGEIGKFNKGSFHLATNLKAPIIPIFVNIPKSIDPGIGYNALPGHVDVYILPKIETKDWSLDDLEKHVEEIRNIYVEFHQKLRNACCSPELHDERKTILRA